MTYRTVLCLGLLLFLIAVGLKAQVYTDRIVHSYRTNEKTSVEVSNKYGKIHVITWDVDSVRFEVDLRISATSNEKLKKLSDNIDFEFTGTQYYIIAKTQFANANNVINDLVDAIIPSNQVMINYMVYVPSGISLKIDNKYGDIYLDDFDGNLDVSLAYGDIKANKINGTPVIKINAGDGTINSINNGKVYVSYSDLRIKDCNNLYLETRSSKLTIDKTVNLKIDSRRDKFDIGEVSRLSATGYFTTMNIASVSNELRCSLKYGNIAVDDIMDSFTFVNINSEYSDIDLFFSRTVSYSLDISHHFDVYINLPGSLSQVQTKDLDVEQKMKLTYGTIGTIGKEGDKKVKLSATKKCNVNLIHR